MALNKTVSFSTGIVATYHVSSEPKISTKDGSGSLVLNTYLDQSSRMAGKKPVANKLYLIPAGVFSSINLSSTDARSLAYVYLKSLPELAGATDN